MRSLRIQLWAAHIGGHWQAAQALAAALKTLEPSAAISLVDIYASSFLRQPLAALIHRYDALVARAPELWGIFFHSANTPTRTQLTRSLIRRAVRKEAVRALLSPPPDVIVRVIVDLGQLETLPQLLTEHPPVITVITDPVGIHRAWLSPHSTAYVVPTIEARDRCLAYGVPADQVRLVGFPIRSELFSVPSSPDHPARAGGPLRVLIMGGSSGAGNIYATVIRLLTAGLNLHVTAVCGRNASLFKALTRWKRHHPTAALSIFGYTDRIPALMHAADVLITKAGPTTIYEAIACQLPVIIDSHLPGQEEGNAELFRRVGIARLSRGPETTLGLIRAMSADPAMLKAMRQPELALETYRTARAIGEYVVQAASQADRGTKWSAMAADVRSKAYLPPS